MKLSDWKNTGASSEALSISQQLLREVPEAREIAEYNYDSDFCFTDEYANMKARMKGCYCEHASPTVLQIDLDAPNVTPEFAAQLRMAMDLGLIPTTPVMTMRPSTGGNLHITITVNESLDVERRILLQALLGSDIKREMLSLAGLLKGRQLHPILFFRPESERPVEATDVFFI